jgi:hypothetical protein
MGRGNWGGFRAEDGRGLKRKREKKGPAVKLPQQARSQVQLGNEGMMFMSFAVIHALFVIF